MKTAKTGSRARLAMAKIAPQLLTPAGSEYVRRATEMVYRRGSFR